MNLQTKLLFSKGKSNNLNQSYGRWKTKKQGISAQVQIYQNGLLEISDTDYSCKTMEFDFDLKFFFEKESLQIIFQRGKQKCAYTLTSSIDFQNWRTILKTKLSQRGFHEQFKVIKKIGKGNFASVFLAKKLEDNVNYAVKAFSKQSAYSEQNGKQSLMNQIEVMRYLNNKNTMKLHQVFQSDNSLYIIFELLQGGQLYDKVKNRYRFNPNEIQIIMYGILKGLQQMHSKGIMHRDLKPENLLFRKEGEWDCVIADFGLSEFVDVETYLFVRCGTPGYVAPQVINIKDMKTKYTTACDLYSLGLIFYVLLFGKSAFSGTSYNEVLAQNRAANIDLNEENCKKVDEDALDLLKMMLKKNPTERITAKQALNHDFFKGVQNFIKQNVPNQENVSKQTIQDNSKCDSPLLTTANKKRKMDKLMKKDSCVQFHMGKQNVVTGKTEEVDSMRQNKVSIINPVLEIRKPKVSQFCVQHKY